MHLHPDTHLKKLRILDTYTKQGMGLPVVHFICTDFPPTLEKRIKFPKLMKDIPTSLIMPYGRIYSCFYNNFSNSVCKNLWNTINLFHQSPDFLLSCNIIRSVLFLLPSNKHYVIYKIAVITKNCTMTSSSFFFYSKRNRANKSTHYT